VEIEAFSPSHLDQAVSLLVDRLQRERDVGLPWRDGFVEPDAVRAYLEEGSGQSGHVAVDDDDVVAFIRTVEKSARPWLPSYWVDHLGHAAATSDAYRHLYATLAGDWVSRGFRDHYVIVPVLDDVVATFFGLGFGLEQIHGIRSLEDVEVRDLPDVEVRRATADDLPQLVPLLDAIAVYQEGSPVFGLNTITKEELEEGHREVLDDPEAHYWIALIDGRAVGFAIFEPAGAGDGPQLPPRTMALNVAAVAEEARGRGVGSALTSAGLRAAAAGFTHCITDWRSANLISGRTWARWGFRPYAYRLHRTIDARVGPA
jgi:GNAT superfamily N-acetyltransferase